MRFFNPQPIREHGLKKSGALVRGISLGSEGPGQSCFIIPVKSSQDEEIDPDRWGIRPTMTHKPQIVANYDPTPGVIAVLTTFNRLGNRLGQIYAIDNGELRQIKLIGYGIGGLAEGGVTWEEAVVVVPPETSVDFYLANVGPPDSLAHIHGKEVIIEPIAPSELEDTIGGELVRIDDPRIPRWSLNGSSPR